MFHKKIHRAGRVRTVKRVVFQINNIIQRMELQKIIEIQKNQTKTKSLFLEINQKKNNNHSKNKTNKKLRKSISKKQKN